MNTDSSSTRLLRDHPVFTIALGTTPLVIMAQTLLSGAILGLTFTIVMVLSMLSVSLFRRLIPHDYRLLFILLISSSWVTVIDLLLLAAIYEIRTGLDFYVPLIAMNSLLLWILEDASLKNSFLSDISLAITSCVLIIVICTVSGSIREILTQGSLLSDIKLLISGMESSGTGPLVQPAWSLPLMETSSGALLTLGCVLAGINYLLSKYDGSDTES